MNAFALKHDFPGVLAPTNLDSPNGKISRLDRINGIRCDLLVDRDQYGQKLGLIDANGFVSERELGDHRDESRLPVRDALAGLVAQRVVSAVPAKGYKVALLTNDVINRNKQVDYDTVAGLCTELQLTANSAIESISSASSREERYSLLGEAKNRLEYAVKKSNSNQLRERGEAVFHATETISLIGSAAGLRWGADTLRSGLDILEISIRWNRDQKNKEVFERPDVVKRVETCKTLIEALSADKVAIQAANGVFSTYLHDRKQELYSSL